MIINELLNEEAACYILLGTVRGIPQSLWLQAQLQLASLDICHKTRSVRVDQCVSAIGAVQVPVNWRNFS